MCVPVWTWILTKIIEKLKANVLKTNIECDCVNVTNVYLSELEMWKNFQHFT